jgi:hypothetical protein
MATNNAINAPLPLSATQGGSGSASPTIHGILVAQGSAAFSPKVLTDGQLLIGDTGSDPVGATLTAGSNISIVNGAGTITISTAGAAGFTWNNVTTSSQALSVHNGYVTDNGASLVTFTLPVTAAFGTEIAISGMSAGGWKIAQNAGQLIHFGDQVTTTGAGGSLESTNAYDQVRLLCVVADTTWNVEYSIGNLTYI